MRRGGNDLINKIFEGKLTTKQKAVVRPNPRTELEQRSEFIYEKYQHRKWFDLKAAQDKSNFQKSKNQPAVSCGEFDDFFALRTKGAASDDWHEDGEGGDPSSKSRGNKNSVTAVSRYPRSNLWNSATALSYDSPTKHQVVGTQSFRQPPSQPLGKTDLLSRTLQRMDSKREMLQTIRGFEKEEGEEILSPRMIKQSSRRLRDSNKSSDRSTGGSTIKSHDPPRRMHSSASGDRESAGGGGGPHRSRSVTSNELRTNGARRGRSGVSPTPPEPSSQKPSSKRGMTTTGRSKTKSPGPFHGRKHGSRNSPVPDEYTGEYNDVLQDSSGDAKRRGVVRTKSMGQYNDRNHRNRRRSASAKRSVRRTHSTKVNDMLKDQNFRTEYDDDDDDNNTSSPTAVDDCHTSSRSGARRRGEGTSGQHPKEQGSSRDDKEISRSSNRSRKEESSPPRSSKNDSHGASNLTSSSRRRIASHGGISKRSDHSISSNNK